MSEQTPEPHVDNHPDETQDGQPLEQFQRDGAEEEELDQVGEGETQDGPP
jgi:hypothetical protein